MEGFIYDWIIYTELLSPIVQRFIIYYILQTGSNRYLCKRPLKAVGI